MTSALIAIAIRDAAPDRTNAQILAKMTSDLQRAEQQAKVCPTNAGICAKCGRLSRFCTGC